MARRATARQIPRAIPPVAPVPPAASGLPACPVGEQRDRIVAAKALHLWGIRRGARIVGRPRLVLALFALAANGIPALALLFYLAILEPGSGSVPDPARASRAVLVALVAIIAVAPVVIAVRNTKALVPILRWLGEDRPATEAEQRAVLRQPLHQALTALGFWAGAAVVFGTIEAALGSSPSRVAALMLGIVLTGVAGAALSTLLTERLLRPLVAEALAGDLPARPYGLGVLPRICLAWAFGSGVPLLGLLLTPVGAGHRSVSSFVLPLSVICAGGLVLGFTIIVGAARSVAEPLADIRDALARVAGGDLDVQVTVDEASEVGQLQAGVNRMVAGLRQRRELEDLFGRYVSHQVASGAMERGVDLTGQRTRATALFVDLVGSTGLAERLAPERVVAALNVYFAAVVDAVVAEDGWVNKFEGDGALCIFGPPAGDTDHAGRALRAAVAIHRAVEAATTPDLPLVAAVGVSSGVVVAGNIGSDQRFEYTVIGDPVNEASRITDLAKTVPGRVLASAATITAAGPAGAGWCESSTTVLRGRSQPTTVYAPAEVGERP